MLITFVHAALASLLLASTAAFGVLFSATYF
jgi:hypothetical protein